MANRRPLRGAFIIPPPQGAVTDLQEADLQDASLKNADLTRAHLRGANLRNANLTGATLRGANLQDAELSGADLTDVTWDAYVTCPDGSRSSASDGDGNTCLSNLK